MFSREEQLRLARESKAMKEQYEMFIKTLPLERQMMTEQLSLAERESYKEWLETDEAKELINQKESQIAHLPFESIKEFIRERTTNTGWLAIDRIKREDNIEKIIFNNYDCHSVELCLELDYSTQEEGYIKALYYNEDSNFFIQPYETFEIMTFWVGHMTIEEIETQEQSEKKWQTMF